jgi:hypothetical protein
MLLGLLIGNLPTIMYFSLILMGLSVSLLGLAIKIRLDDKRRTNTPDPLPAPESIQSHAL